MTSTMNRIVHDAVRRDLDRFTAALTTYREPDRQRAGQLADAWRFLRTMLTRHQAAFRPSCRLSPVRPGSAT